MCARAHIRGRGVWRSLLGALQPHFKNRAGTRASVDTGVITTFVIVRRRCRRTACQLEPLNASADEVTLGRGRKRGCRESHGAVPESDALPPPAESVARGARVVRGRDQGAGWQAGALARAPSSEKVIKNTYKL